ncbi:MAG: hypothetical protein ACO1Q7_13055 [Gemmatimonas sp.]
MPFFAHPVDPTSWLLPLVSMILRAASAMFWVIEKIAPIGVVVLFVVVVALFSMNIMKEPYKS